MAKRTLIRDLFKKNPVAEFQRGVAAEIDRPCHLIGSRAFHHDSPSLIHGTLEGLCVLDAGCIRKNR